MYIHITMVTDKQAAAVVSMTARAGFNSAVSRYTAEFDSSVGKTTWSLTSKCIFKIIFTDLGSQEADSPLPHFGPHRLALDILIGLCQFTCKKTTKKWCDNLIQNSPPAIPAPTFLL